MFLGLIISVVNDLELTASQSVKLILLLILGTGVGLNIYWTIRAQSIRKKTIRASVGIVLLLAILPVWKWYDIENNLLHKAKYTTGTTLNICDEFAKGAAIQFSYEVDGIKYQNCNTFHPVSINQIKVPGGQYSVLYSVKYPEIGRMDFNKPRP